ncbi:MAG: TetR/AcrR family transcriptional regulator, partial [Mycobacteriaceae bacterium]
CCARCSPSACTPTSWRRSAATTPDLRQNLIGSFLVGLVMTRHVARLEPIASADKARLVELLAPTLQRFVADPL